VQTHRSGGILYKELSYALVGCAQRVHSELGPGFPEKVYDKALAHELAKTRIAFQAQARFEVSYDGIACGEFRVDFYVDGKIIVEIKAAEAICKQHEAQVLAYLKASGAHLAILLNFGEASLRVKRFVSKGVVL